MDKKDDSHTRRSVNQDSNQDNQYKDNLNEENMDLQNGEIDNKERTDEEKNEKSKTIDEINNNKENIRNLKEDVGRNKRKKIYTGIICVFALIITMYFGAKRYDYLVYPNITLYKEDLSKLDKNQLNSKINDLANNINNNSIIVKVNDKEYKILVSDIIYKLDKDNVKNKIMNYGKDKTFLEQFGLIYLSVERNYKFDIKINTDKLQEEIKKIYEDTYIEAVEPKFEINGDNLNIIKDQDGKSIDEEDLMNKIIEKVNSDEVEDNNIVIQEEYKTIKSKISSDDLKGLDYKISSATTYFAGTGYNRGLNIANATNKINGTLLMPGDEFSYEEKVSPVELNNGYYMAPAIINGKHKDAPGGGVCQVSSTLYNAELKAGILPTERYNHSKSVSYVQKGLDATLATGSKNLRFKNPYNYPIYIHAYIIGGQITVEFWSNKSVLEGIKYTPVSFIKGNVANAYLYGYNSKGKLIYKKFIDTSIYK